MKKNFKKQILLQNVQMDSSVNFQVNGDIQICPCPWESDKEVTPGERVRYEGGIEVDADGHTRVKRWNRGSRGPMYETVFETAHGAVKLTREKGRRGRVKIDFSFPKSYPLELTKQCFRDESLEIFAWMMTRKTNTLWINN